MVETVQTYILMHKDIPVANIRLGGRGGQSRPAVRGLPVR